MFVYLITCHVNGKNYVGKTKDTIENRWKQHRKAARLGSDQLICRAIRKHGVDNFSIRALVCCNSEEELNRTEISKIAELKTFPPSLGFGYNETKGGDGGAGHSPGESHPMFGRHHSDETRRQMSQSHKGKHSSENHRIDCRCFVCRMKDQCGDKNPMFGRSPSEICLAKARITAKVMGLANRGRKASPESRAKMSAALKGRKKSFETRARMSAALKLRHARKKSILPGRLGLICLS